MQERILTGCIANLAIFSLVEFGTRASFKIECAARSSIVCAVEGDVAREFIPLLRGRYGGRKGC